jgi:hypothetical protein
MCTILVLSKNKLEHFYCACWHDLIGKRLCRTISAETNISREEGESENLFNFLREGITGEPAPPLH